jgi:PTH1 family peptidyl-tRNA hydrolase
MENLYLVAGLGNPGRQYARTRHNAGFMVLDQLADRWKAGWAMDKKSNSRIARAERAGKRLILCQPETFMNSSGEAVGALVNFQKIPTGRLLVRQSGSSRSCERNAHSIGSNSSPPRRSGR